MAITVHHNTTFGSMIWDYNEWGILKLQTLRNTDINTFDRINDWNTTEIMNSLKWREKYNLWQFPKRWQYWNLKLDNLETMNSLQRRLKHNLWLCAERWQYKSDASWNYRISDAILIKKLCTSWNYRRWNLSWWKIEPLREYNQYNNDEKWWECWNYRFFF